MFSRRFSRLLAATFVIAALSITTALPGRAADAPAKPAAAASVPAVAPSSSLLNAAPSAQVPAAAASAVVAVAPAAAASAPSKGLDDRIQDVKGDVIKLNRDLLVLEEELLFPANTQVALFVSMDVGKLFSLDSVQIKLDDKLVTNYLYTPLEVDALHRGGVQRVYLGNLKAGKHQIVAFFTGQGPHERDYKRGTTIKFDKGVDPKYIELQIKDSTAKLQPEFEVKVWQ